MRVLVANAGSSSLKLRLLEADDRLAGSVDLAASRGQADVAAIAQAVRGFGRVDAVGHRIVHGGAEFTRALRVDAEVVRKLEELSDLAPLHQPVSLAMLAAVTEAMPEAPAVACFDTAFHAGLPPAASTYALPAAWRKRWGLRRYGFHGLSHAYAARRTLELLEGGPGLRLVSCHLGSGASLAAVVDGHSLDTTMGFTPLDGLVMATRPGSLDPGLVLWLQRHVGLGAEEIADALDHESGLMALAGTSDMREIEKRVEAGDDTARLALDVYVHRLRAGIASMAAAMGGVDAIVFTGGVGEHSAAVRQRTAEGLLFLGLTLDSTANATGTADRRISAEGSRVRALVVAAREDLEIARQVREVMTT